MFAATRLTRLRHDTSRILSHWILPLGWLALLTGMFWVGDRSDYHRLFYILLAAPTLLYVILQPRLLRPLTGSPLFIAFLAFSSYMMLSLSWSAPENSTGSLLKRPLYIALLFFCAAILALEAPLRLKTATWLAALGAVISAAATLLQYYWDANPLRLTGYGALYNPLLSAHVYGAFTAFWLAYWMQSRPILAPLPLISLALLGGLLIATGSRTPLVGLTAALMWLVLAGDRKKALIALALALAGALLGYILYPEVITQRGASFRPEIWADALRQISEHPWLGHGYDHPMRIVLSNGMLLADPHNIELGVLFAGGIIGLLLWVAIYALAFAFSWKNRKSPAVLLASTWLVFGLAAGLTEGNAFLPRPKEHWFLIWIPMALLYALWIQQRFAASRRGEDTAAP
ncbi:TPA: O-antigen ligase family protein [Pseudomonas aeruginosa]|jgi:O-antigen ligase|uniref:O-antigen ligase WaaL n=1 Tax=Pseudomonas TaxID=286 RepID=UPI000281AA6B|nr:MULTISPECIES: O-antigen ligase WaaL [Pseudomonas]APB67889.1 ligase [Pseudomonas aeruginosa]ARI94258.1 ligase [Pseudomonas aeruginosa]ARJ00795.1 ligase [Pseudomonas aeruginosa]ASA18521.1 ligase [Pseudomonas aeruginosa]AVK20214.1 O-antigen ligase like membrane family protein [Pseudomonas aeruginosa]